MANESRLSPGVKTVERGLKREELTILSKSAADKKDARVSGQETKFLIQPAD